MYIDDKFVKQYDSLITDRISKAKIHGEFFDQVKAKVYERILVSNSYDPEKGKVSTWLWNICRSVISNEVARRSRSQDVLDHPLLDINGVGSIIGKEDAGEESDELERIFNASGLSKQSIRILKKHHIEGLSMPEVAEQEDMEQRAVEQVIYRAMKTLRESVDRDV